MTWEYIQLTYRMGYAGYEPYSSGQKEAWLYQDRTWFVLTDALNDLGQEGWECIGLRQIRHGDQWAKAEYVPILKRAIA